MYIQKLQTMHEVILAVHFQTVFSHIGKIWIINLVCTIIEGRNNLSLDNSHSNFAAVDFDMHNIFDIKVDWMSQRSHIFPQTTLICIIYQSFSGDLQSQEPVLSHTISIAAYHWNLFSWGQFSRHGDQWDLLEYIFHRYQWYLLYIEMLSWNV